MTEELRAHDLGHCRQCGRALPQWYFSRRAYCSIQCSNDWRKARLYARRAALAASVPVKPPAVPAPARKAPARTSKRVYDLSAAEIEARLEAAARQLKAERVHTVDAWAGYRSSLSWE